MRSLTEEQVSEIQAEIHKLSPDELWIEVAKGRGWKEVRLIHFQLAAHPGRTDLDALGTLKVLTGVPPESGDSNMVPDYINDLVACLSLMEEAGIVLIPVKLYSRYNAQGNTDEADCIGTRWKAWAMEIDGVMTEEGYIDNIDKVVALPVYEKPGEAVCRAYVEYLRIENPFWRG